MNNGKIIIRKLEIFAHHGVMDFEKEKGQTFYIDGTFYVDIITPGTNDNLEDTVNYAQICEELTVFLQKNRFDLIEAAAYQACSLILKKHPKIRKAELTIHKPSAPIGLPFEDVAVEISLEWHRAYLSIGSNIGDSQNYLNYAIDSLYDDDNCRVLGVSDFVVTKPYGPVEQEDFLNGCVEIETIYTPQQLLVCINDIEQGAGRTREIHWGPRTLDVDIILYDNEMVCQPDLIIPHKEMHKRAFVLVPLAQIAPYAVNPVFNKTVEVLLSELPQSEKQSACGACSGCSGCQNNNKIR